MTHPPTLPNGFSTDFSEAPTMHPQILVWAMAGLEIVPAYGYLAPDYKSVWVCGRDVPIAHCLCWAHVDRAAIPTPGDAVLKELEEKANG